MVKLAGSTGASSLKLSKTLADKYPKNFDFQVHYTFSLMVTSNLKGAKKQLNDEKSDLDE